MIVETTSTRTALSAEVANALLTILWGNGLTVLNSSLPVQEAFRIEATRILRQVGKPTRIVITVEDTDDVR